MMKHRSFVVALACACALMFSACSHKTQESTQKEDSAKQGEVKTPADDGATPVKIHVDKGSTTYRLCLDPDNTDNCTTPTLQNEEGDYYLTKLGIVNSMFAQSEAKADENCKTSAVGYDTCKERGDYYNLAKAACKKAGGALPTINELITLKKYMPSFFPWGMFTWSSDVLTKAEDSYGIGSWYQMYSDGTETNPKIHIHNNDTSDRGVGNIQVLCVAR